MLEQRRLARLAGMTLLYALTGIIIVALMVAFIKPLA